MKFIQALFLISIISYANFAWSECLSYEPSVVSLSGELDRRTFPGRPNYEYINKGDEPETGFYLILESPVCVKGDDSSPFHYPQNEVNLVQLILDKKGYEKFRHFLNKKIKVRGTLFGSHTGHHHAPLIISSVEFEL